MTARISELAAAGVRTIPGPDPSKDADLRRFRSYTYSSLVGPPAVLLALFAVLSGVPYPPDPLGIVEFAGVAIVVVAIARLGERHIPRRPDQRPLSRQAWRAWSAVGCVGAVVTAALWVRAGEAWLWSFAPAVIVSLLIAGLSPARRRPAVPAVILAMAGMGVAGGALRGQPIEGFALSGVMWTGFWLFVTLASIWTWQVVVQLNEAGRTAATLAVANERLRFAADLHDIQGHSLQVIALKSELACRLARRDPAAAAVQMAAVQQLAGEALDDTRTVVAGYRRANLDTEIANATNVLGSAGIDARLHVAPGLDASMLHGPVRHLLGLVVREAVTNVLRHSAATRAEVAMGLDEGGRIRLTVRNDGVDRTPTAPGSGLSHLSNRVHAAGGQLTWQRTNDTFEIRAEMPVTVTSTARDGAASA